MSLTLCIVNDVTRQKYFYYIEITDKKLSSSNKVAESFKLDALSLHMSSHCVCMSVYMYDVRKMWNSSIFHKVNF